MKKRANKKPAIVRFRPNSIAVHISKNGKVTEDENRKAIIEEQLCTYGIKKDIKKKKFIIYELKRKGNHRRVKTIKAKKKERISDIRNKIQTNQIRFNKKYIDTRNESILIQTNYKANIKKNMGFVNAKSGKTLHSPQLIGIVEVYDKKRHIVDNFLGYSRRLQNFKLNISNAKAEIIEVAKAKFYDVYGHPVNSDDIQARIIEIRWQYYQKIQ